MRPLQYDSRKHLAVVKQKRMAEWEVARAEDAQLQETSNPEILQRPDIIQVDGQTFAATVLFALSCSPLLKAHLLQSLNATSEEIDSLEPFLSAAWDQWNQAVSSVQVFFLCDLRWLTILTLL